MFVVLKELRKLENTIYGTLEESDHRSRSDSNAHILEASTKEDQEPTNRLESCGHDETLTSLSETSDESTDISDAIVGSDIRLVQLDDLSDLESYLFADTPEQDIEGHLSIQIPSFDKIESVIQVTEVGDFPQESDPLEDSSSNNPDSPSNAFEKFLLEMKHNKEAFDKKGSSKSSRTKKAKSGRITRKSRNKKPWNEPHKEDEEAENPPTELEIYLKKGGDAQRRYSSYGSTLQYHAATGNEDMVHLLLIHGARVNLTEKENTFGGNCPLMAAVSSGKVSLVELLLQHGALPEIAYGFWGNILHTAAYLGHLNIVKLILDAKTGIDINEINKSFLLTPLGMMLEYQYKVLNQDYEVVQGDRLEIMRMLVEAGATMTKEQTLDWWKIATKVTKFGFLTKADWVPEHTSQKW
jgi:hypothetical protein